MRATLVLSIGLLVLIAGRVHGQGQSDKLVIATPPFSMTEESLKKPTKGVNVERLVAAIVKSKPPVKSEYETKAEFDERILKWGGKKLLGNIGAGSRVAVIQPAVLMPFTYLGPALETSYNAETEMMTAMLRSGLFCAILIRSTRTPKGQYSATNGFGRKVTVLEIAEKRDCIAFGSNGALKSAEKSFAFQVARKQAEATALSLELVVIGRLAQP